MDNFNDFDEIGFDEEEGEDWKNRRSKNEWI